jgi:hypothetical protein
MNQPIRFSFPSPNVKQRHPERLYATPAIAAVAATTSEAARTIHWPATIQSISSGGLSLVVCHALRTGEFLTIQLDDAFEGARKKFFVRVKRATARGGGVWVLGCRLVARFRNDELEKFQ